MANRLDRYKTHFYCALCGGPFAQVFRTATAPASKRASHRFDRHQTEASEDLDLGNEFNIPVDDNREIPEEVVLENMGFAASRHRAHRIKAFKSGLRRGIMTEENRRTWRAYDGRRISTQQMEWLTHLRALIHKRAKYCPIGGNEFLSDTVLQFLTGRGRIRQIDAWADAYATYEEEEDPDFELAQLANRSRYGFHVYQEFNRNDSDFVISSIPFHEQCWDLLFYAIEVSARERGVDTSLNPVDEDDSILWGHLRGLVGISGVAKWVGQSTFSALHGSMRGEVITRLGEVDYREAQGSGEGFQWRHDEGLHWIVADPDLSATKIFEEPLKIINKSLRSRMNRGGRSFYPRPALRDPFNEVPHEIIVEVFRYLTSTDIFSLKQASPAVCVVHLPTTMYKRFIQEEFDYYPPLITAVRQYEEGDIKLKSNEMIDWKGTFEAIRMSIRTPEPGDGSEWDEIDISLKNRNRIWKIVKPIAEELVESCPSVLHQKYGVALQTAKRTSVVRGCVGTRSGKEGVFECAYFGDRAKLLVENEEEEEDIVTELLKVRVYLTHDGDDGQILCGLGFVVNDEEDEEEDEELFGRRTPDYTDVDLDGKLLEGFVFCFTKNVVGGIRLVFRHSKFSTFSAPIGKWEGVMRKVIAPHEYRILVGVTGFINSSGFIEKIGLLEQTLIRKSEDQYGHIPTPPLRVELSHEESSVWNRLPPTNARFIEREGLKIRNWRLHMAEWEIWSPEYQEEGVAIPQRQERKDLCEIVGHYDRQFLRGLCFVYDTPRGKIESRLGVTKSERRSSFKIERGEKISAVVISFGVDGVHGILFVTDNSRKSDVFGPRYLGTHKVFGPLLLNGQRGTAFRYDIQGVDSIIGLHCLFDYEVDRFLQLGIILPMDEDVVYAQPSLRPIPFDEVDDNSLQYEDEPLPTDLQVGKEAGSLLADTTESTFTGWIDLSTDLRRIITYGRMKGIRFIYKRFESDSRRRDIYFGDTEDNSDTSVQVIAEKERVIGVYAIDDEEYQSENEMVADYDTVSATSKNDGSAAMPRLWFLTNRNASDKPPNSRRLVKSSSLRGLKFDFNADRIQSWLPMYKSDNQETSLPWTHCGIKADHSLPRTCTVSYKFFDENLEGKRVDAVKGYITRDGKFCGLLFRKNGEWDDNVFGEMSAFEVTMELGKNERFTSAYTSGTTALALVTNTGKCTPWFGKVTEAKQLSKPPGPNMVAVGVYGAVEKRYVDHIEWTVLGLLYLPRGSTPEKTSVEPGIPLSLKFPDTDRETNLPWFSDINNKRLDYELAPMAADRSYLYDTSDDEDNSILRHEEYWRAYLTYDPFELEQIRVFVNRNLATKGIRALRLRGTKKMGSITMGQWTNYTDAYSAVKRSEKMKIKGPAGERIKRVKVFTRGTDMEDRVVGLEIETCGGRRKILFSHDDPTVKNDPLCGTLSHRWLECREGYEIVGFHGIFSRMHMHDIGLVIRPISNAPLFNHGNMTRATEGLDSHAASSRASWNSQSVLGDSESSACTEDSAPSSSPVTRQNTHGAFPMNAGPQWGSPYIHSPSQLRGNNGMTN